jgi:hypothetical protein
MLQMKKTLNFLQNLPEGFSAKRKTMFGKNMVLITPTDIKTKWDKDTEMFRSCIFDEDTGKIYSMGFKKFSNFSENPDFQPWDISWKFEARHKIDGSLLLISKVDGNILVRTRGVFDAREHETGDEIDGLIQKYEGLFDNKFINSENYTILCEHTTPKRIIVLRESEEPKLTLLGIINHDTLEYIPQFVLDSFAMVVEIDRPQKYEYNSISECIADVAAWVGKEGVIVHSPDYQTLKKIKAEQYLALHKICTGMRSISNVLDVFIESPRFVEYQDFYNFVLTTIDYEVAEKIKDDIAKITEAYGKFIHSVNTIERAMEYISKLDSRKKQAMAIQEHWDGFMIPVGFSLLDNKPLDDKLVKKSMEKLLNL